MSAPRDSHFVTVGHSTDTLEAFVARLQGARVSSIVDVRTLPGSTKFPHFNDEVLRVELPKQGIAYHRVEQLGGLRRRSREIDASVNGMWQNRSFHNYADYTLGEEFSAGFEELLRIGKDSRVAIMCAEAVWWRCHRRIIADRLITRGFTVEHLMPNGSLTEASLTPGASIDASSQRITYPATEQ